MHMKIKNQVLDTNNADDFDKAIRLLGYFNFEDMPYQQRCSLFRLFQGALDEKGYYLSSGKIHHRLDDLEDDWAMGQIYDMPTGDD